ncbi:MAG TPA: hypothetical protein VFS70_07785, partial [Actinomycetota bacterium]|nr:hypothetical protein [Actinomycetota bacterium]
DETGRRVADATLAAKAALDRDHDARVAVNGEPVADEDRLLDSPVRCVTGRCRHRDVWTRNPSGVCGRHTNAQREADRQAGIAEAEAIGRAAAQARVLDMVEAWTPEPTAADAEFAGTYANAIAAGANVADATKLAQARAEAVRQLDAELAATGEVVNRPSDGLLSGEDRPALVECSCRPGAVGRRPDARCPVHGVTGTNPDPITLID